MYICFEQQILTDKTMETIFKLLGRLTGRIAYFIRIKKTGPVLLIIGVVYLIINHNLNSNKNERNSTNIESAMRSFKGGMCCAGVGVAPGSVAPGSVRALKHLHSDKPNLFVLFLRIFAWFSSISLYQPQTHCRKIYPNTP